MIPDSLIAIAVILSALALWVLSARPQSAINRWFAAYTLAMSGWAFSIGVLHAGISPETWSRLAFASASLIPGCFLAFTTVYPTPSSWPPRSVLRGVLLVSAAFALISIATPLLVHDAEITSQGFARKSGRLYPLFVVYFLAAWLTAFAVFVTKWRRARGQARAQLQYLGIGLVISFVGGITTNLLFPFLLHRTADTWLGPFFTLPLVVLACHAIIRHRLMDLRIVIHRGSAYVLTIALMSVAGIGFVTFFVPEWANHSVFIRSEILIVAAVTAILLSTPGQWFMRRFVDPYLYRGRVEYASALHNATHRLSHLRQPQELSQELREILRSAFAPETFVMVARTSEAGRFEQLSADSPAVIETLSSATAVAELIDTQPSPVVTVINPHRESDNRSAHELLRTAGVEVMIILGRREQLLGAVFLGPRKSGDAYFTSDLTFLESVAEIASIALENALLYRQRLEMLDYSDRLLESLDSAVVAVDVKGRITSFNRAAMVLLGVTSSDRGAQLDVLPTEVAWALAMAIQGAWIPREVEASVANTHRDPLPVILSAAVLHDDREQVTGALVVVTDLSTIRALERNQRRMEHLALMARFYAGIAHEIRSPLAAISNFIAMLPDRFNDQEYRDTAIRLLPIEVDRIVKLADRLRLMAPSEDAKLSAVSLPPLLADLVAIHTPIANDNGIKLVLQCPDELPKLLADQSQLVQLFVNLLKNAIEAMPNGGTVTITAMHATAHTDSGLIIVRIIDEGVGIDPPLRPKIFQPFFTTKPSGTGLGLSICKEVADFHRARLALLPRFASSGTVAEIEFPCLPQSDPEEVPRLKARSPLG